MRWFRRVLTLLTLAGAVIVAIAALAPPQDRQPLPPRSGPAIGEAVSWGYQLQNVDPATIPDSVNLLVTDFSRDGSDLGAWTAADVDALRRRPDATPRIVLAYLSIGEAESYRGYWRRHWRVSPPAWLGAENKDWAGNFAVRFWEPGWQRLIFDAAPGLVARTVSYWFPGYSHAPYLDRILAAGFDGIFLDKVDGYEDWSAERPQAADDMVGFVTAIADYARRRRPGFLVVPQNAEELLRNAGYRATIDAIAKEDLFLGIGGDGTPNAPGEIDDARNLLLGAAAAGKPVFVVEYTSDPATMNNLRLQAGTLGFRLLFATRELDLPPMPETSAPPE